MSKLCNWFINNEYGNNEELFNNGKGCGFGFGSGYGNSFGFCYGSHPNDCDFSNGVSFGYGTGEGCGYKNGLVDIPFNHFRGFLDE